MQACAKSGLHPLSAPEEKVRYKAEQAKKKLVANMGVDPDNDWVAEYEVIPGKEKVVKELQQLAKKADEIYLATDLDREGEAIAWHLAEILGGDPSRYRRVTFNEITKKAIQEAFKVPSQVNQDRVDAQQARRFLDRVVGSWSARCCGARWQKLSAGQFNGCGAFGVEREREIRAFVPDEYWDLHADLAGQAGSAEFSHKRWRQSHQNAQSSGSRCRGRPNTVGRDIAYCRSRRQANTNQTQCAVHYVDIAASCEYTIGLWRKEDHDAGTASV